MSNGIGRWLMDHLWQLSIELAILAGVVMAAIYVLRIKSPALRDAGETPVPALTTEMETKAGTNTEIRTASAALPPARARLNRHGAIGLAWLMVALLLGVRLLASYAFVGLLRQSATLHDDGPLADAAEEASRAIRLRRGLRLAVSDAVRGPILTGILRPTVLLPRRIVDGLSAEQLKLTLMHESVHVRRWDNLVLVVQRLAEMLLFFHPAIWLCSWMMRREAEAACDDAVLAASGRVGEVRRQPHTRG